MKKLKSFLAFLTLAICISCGNDDSESRLEESGTVESLNITVSAQTSGKIVTINFDEGELVSNGDTLLIIDHELLEIHLNQATAAQNIAQAKLNLLIEGARKEDIQQAEELLKQAEASYLMTKRDHERMKNLYESQAVTKKQYDDSKTMLDVTLAKLNSAKKNLEKLNNIARPEEINAAKANLEAALGSIELVKKQIKDSYVVSPSNGFIVNKFVEIGETVGPMTALFKISDLSEIDVVVYIPGKDLGKVKLGQTAEIYTDTYPDKSYEGKVIYISPEAEFTPKNIQTKEERTKLVYAVKIKAQNDNFELKSGMPVDVVILI